MKIVYIYYSPLCYYKMIKKKKMQIHLVPINYKIKNNKKKNSEFPIIEFIINQNIYLCIYN